MKKLLYLLALMLFTTGFTQKPPQKIKSEFTAEVLSQKILSPEGKKQSIADVLMPYRGQVVIIDFWASWCRDCILALPKTEELKSANPEVEFLYFSLDRTYDQWKKGLEKYGIADQKNYWFDEGWKNKFNNYIELNWVPRFIVVDQTGKIADYYAISPADPELVATLKRLTEK
jgi:thiol-disulfide isomerase/thioredoxin